MLPLLPGNQPDQSLHCQNDHNDQRGKKLLVFNLFDKVYLGEYPMASLIATLIIVIVLAVEGLVWLISRKEGTYRVS